MRPFLLASALLIAPATGFAQSTVGAVPSNPNNMPAVDGSSAPKVATTTKSTKTMSSSTRKSAHKKASSPPQ